MSEFGVPGTSTGAATPANRGAAIPIAHESYAFACMRCGHGWEQSYEIEHHVDGDGAPYVQYVAGGERVPSPLTRPTCLNCDGHVLRIMRAGRVSSAQNVMHPSRRHETPAAGPVEAPGPEAGTPALAASSASSASSADRQRHHWHLSDLLHPFAHHKKEA
ncbi:hypothetical protein [Streptomyces sp. NPDC016845]|uniref:hypothetical protein n=1 Tax=Streptomyces sp. NPDC016845 TaxID=3364972 RepID=UPI0037A0293E